MRIPRQLLCSLLGVNLLLIPEHRIVSLLLLLIGEDLKITELLPPILIYRINDSFHVTLLALQLGHVVR